MRKPLILGLALASALAFGGYASAATDDTPPPPPPHGQVDGPHGHGRHGMRGGRGDMPGGMFGLHKLDLTDAQKTSIRTIMKDGFASSKTQREALFKQRKAFDSLTPDQAGYQAAADRLAQAEGDAAKARVEQQASVRAKIYGVLTTAQKTKLASLRAEREQRMQEWKASRAQHRADSAKPAAKPAGK